MLLMQVVDYYNETLKQSPEALKYLAIARPHIVGDDRPVQAGLRQPDAGVSTAGEEPRRRRGDAWPAADGWASCARAAMSTSTAPS